MSKLLNHILDLFKNYVFDNIINTTDLFFAGNVFYLVVTIAAFCYLICNRKKLITGHHMIAAYTVLLVILVIFNPLLPMFIFKTDVANTNVFARFWLLCPIWLLLSYVVASLPLKKIPRAIAVFILSVAVVYFGNSVITMNQSIEPENSYKIKAGATELSEEILLINNNQPASVFMFDQPHGEDNYEQGGTLYYGMLQYTGKLKIDRFIFSNDRWDNYFVSQYIEGSEWITSEEFIRWILIDYGVFDYDYVIWPDDPIIISKMEFCGYRLVGNAGGYNIFQESSD